MTLPSVGVVIPTNSGRPEMLRRAIASVAAQTYAGRVEVVVVHDHVDLDHTLGVRVVPNVRTRGLAGTRNSGILALDTDYVAFLDDDDHWLPEKLERQIARAVAGDAPELVSCAIRTEFDGRTADRTAGTDTVTHAHLTASRMSMLHSSGLLFERAALVDPDRIGLVNEEIPGSHHEDWDMLLRAAVRRPIAHVDEPLVMVRMGRSSMFARSWEGKVTAFKWMMEHHPAIETDHRGASLVYGQIAFGEGARGHRADSLRWAGRAFRARPLQWRVYAALPVAAGVVRGETVLNVLHRFGRGV